MGQASGLQGQRVRGCLAVARGLIVLSIVAGSAAAAAKTDPNDWHDVKCKRYTRAWSFALARQGMRGLSKDFLDSHAAFLASNCTRRADVCAKSAEELELANTMVVLSMNAGTASTFPPFYCRK